MGNDPTTTIPGAPSGNVGLILVLTLLTAFLVPVALHVLYRSTRRRAGATHKAVAGGLGAVAFLVATFLAVQVAGAALAVLMALLALASLGYAFPRVRSLVRAKASELHDLVHAKVSELRNHSSAAPQQPPDHAAH